MDSDMFTFYFYPVVLQCDLHHLVRTKFLYAVDTMNCVLCWLIVEIIYGLSETHFYNVFAYPSSTFEHDIHNIMSTWFYCGM